jgi:hypothetical protein
MKQAKLTHDQIEDLHCKGYTFTRRFYYWTVLENSNIVNRIARLEFMGRAISEPFYGIQQVRIYERCIK